MTAPSPYEDGTPPPIALRHRLLIARETAGLEQNQLADLIGVSRNTISNAEKGRVHPRRITINAVALATHVPVSWLLEGDNEEGQLPAGPGVPAKPPTPGRRKPATKVSRRRYATLGFAGTHNLRAVQEALGHASVATTQRYTAVSTRDVRAVSEAACRIPSPSPAAAPRRPGP